MLKRKHPKLFKMGSLFMMVIDEVSMLGQEEVSMEG